MFALLASVGVGCAVAGAGLVAASVLRSAFGRYRERYLAPSVRDLGAMFLFIEPGSLVALNASALVVAVAIGAALGGPLLALPLAVVGFFTPQILVRIQKSRRRARFDRQLVDALMAVAAALRAGLTFQQAADQVARDAPVPLGQELSLLVREIRLGMTVDDALVSLGKRVGSEDLDLVVTATTIARQLGGNLGEILETIAATVRERFRIQARVAALTAQGKLQGLIVASMPIALGIVLDRMRPDLTRPMLAHAFGYALVGLVVVMELTGMLLIRKIVRIEV